jgi:hypothetical protein
MADILVRGVDESLAGVDTNDSAEACKTRHTDPWAWT